MKIRGILLLLLIIASFVFNYYYLKIPLLQFSGIVLVGLLFFFVILNFFFKFKNRNNPNQEKHSYAFPDVMAKAMKNVDQRTQYESALLSMFFMLIGMIAFTIYITAFTANSWWFKGFFIFNAFWGVVLMTSFMVTQYQAYNNYMMIMEEIGAPTNTKKLIEVVPNLNKMKGGKKTNGI